MSQILKPKKGYKKVKWLFGKEIEIPEEWSSKKVEDVFKLKSGSTPSRTKPEFFEGDISWVTSTDLIEKITKNAVKDARLTILTKGTFLIATYGLEADKTRGKCGIIEMNATCNQACMAFLPSSEMDSLFLFYFYLCFGEKIIFSIAQGTKQQNLYSETVKKVTLLIPPLKEQQKIASILSNVDELVTSTQKVIDQTKSTKKGLMQKLLTRGIGHTKFKKVTMGLRYMVEEYPEEWEITTLGKNCKLERGKFGHRPRDDPEYYGGKYPFIQTGDVEKSNRYINTFSQTLNEKGLKVSKIFPKDIIVITIAANIGTTSITKFPVCFPDSLIGISTDLMDVRFLEYFLQTRKNYLNIIATASAQKNINYETLKPLQIPNPPSNEQQKIAMILSNIDSQIQSQTQYKEKLERLKKSLMQKLLTGQVRVTA